MFDEKLRSMEIVEKLIELASRSSSFWRNFGRIVIPANQFESLLKQLVDELPIDLKKAEEMLAERDRLMEEAVARSEKIVDDAAEEAGRLLDESEIVAKARKSSMIIRNEADQYVVEILENLEDQVAELLTRIKKAQLDLVNDMERRREKELKRRDV